MSPKYCLFLLLLGTSLARAQNTPDLTATAPAGTATQITLPSTLSVPTGSTPSCIRTFVPRIPMTNALSVNQYSNPAQVQQATVYKDGFNRSIQAVQHYGTTGSRPHLVVPNDTRFQADDVSFLPYPADNTAYDALLFTRQYDYYLNEAYTGEGYTSYSITKNISNNQQRATKSLAPGRSQVGQNRGITIKKVTNTAGEVKLWEPDANGKPQSSGTYPAGSLFGELAYDTMGAATLSYTDKDGRLVYRSVRQNDQSSGGLVVTISGVTTYVYDVKGNLVGVMPPKATAASPGSTVPQAVWDNLCFQYVYDSKGRKIEQKFPGKAVEYFVYDNRNRLVLYQDGNLRAQQNWTFNAYDRLDRVLFSGLYFTTNEPRSILQDFFTNGISYPAIYLIHFLKDYEMMGVYLTAPVINTTVLQEYYYDNYTNADPSGSLFSTTQGAVAFTTAELMNTAGAEVPQRASQQQGRVTGSKIRILTAPGADVPKTGDWRTTVNYYDNKGRVIYTASQDRYQGNTIHAHYTAMQYDFANRLLQSKHMMQNTNGQSTQHTEWSKNEYDALTGKPFKTWHRTDAGAWNLQALYSYDALGRVKRKVMGDYGEVQDYDYNIRGQLSGINALYARTGDRQGESRSFGQSLCYDYGFSKPRYDGKLAGMIWRGAGSSLASAYGYSYDYSGRLTEADYNRYEPPIPGVTLGYSWRKDQVDYTTDKISYDRDGNIAAMSQQGVKPGVGIVSMDQLQYTYENGGQSNRLQKVEDNATFYDLGDFNNTNGTAADYAYDPNGNLTQDNNKGITAVTYTYFNKPQSVSISGGKTILYSYDAAGNKVQEMIQRPGINKQVTDYIGNYVYRNDTLQYAQTGEGRSTYDPVAAKFKEEYFVKDQLGNVRSVVEVYVPPVKEYLASYEVASANLEGLFFDHMDPIRDDKPGGNPGDNKAGNLNGGDPNRRVGTSMLLKVMAGDKVELNVNSYYEAYNKDADEPVSVENMLSTVISTLTGGTGGLPGESHNTKKVTESFTSNNYNAFNDLVTASADLNKPRAYLNYILFDEGMKIVSTMSGAFQANGEGSWAPIGTTAPMEIPVNGFLAVYLSNASTNKVNTLYGNVYFDQLVIRFSSGKLKEEAHYYPHGLPISGMGSVASGMKDNRRRYQSNEYIKDLGLNWMDFNNRQYDPQIGRFLSVDPLAPETITFSPYAAMNNNPASLTDPDGLKVGSELTYAWGRREPFRSKWEKEMDEIMSYLNAMRMSTSGMSWDGGRSFGVNDRIVKIITATWARMLGETISMEGWTANFENENLKDYTISAGGLHTGGGGDGTTTYSLKDMEKHIFRDAQYNTMDCGYYVLAVIDSYLGSNKGYDGKSRSVGEFKSLNGDREGVSGAELEPLLVNAGMEYSKSGTTSGVLSGLKKGYPTISGENGRGSGHFVLIFEMTYIPNTGIITKVYNPATGEIENRTIDYFNPEKRRAYQHSTGLMFTIQKP